NDLSAWAHAFHHNLLERPWLPHLMMREVLPQGGELRELFLQHFAPRVFGHAKQLMTRTLKRSARSRKLDVDRHLMLLMGMLVYPFLGLEVAQSLTGRRFDTVMMQSFRDDALSLFHKGTGVDP